MSAVRQTYWLAVNIYFEARGESYEGKKAVGHVTLNRVHGSGKSVKDVVFQKHQFSWTGDDIEDVIKDHGTFAECLQAAYDCLEEQLYGINLWGATHFFNPSKMSAIPRWASALEPVTSIGEHQFYREK